MKKKHKMPETAHAEPDFKKMMKIQIGRKIVYIDLVEDKDGVITPVVYKNRYKKKIKK